MIKTKLTNTGKDIFALMEDLTNNSGIINLAKATTDFLCPEELKKLAIKFLQNDYNHYTYADGVFALREAIAQQIAEKFNLNFNPSDEITITAGATQAIYTTISSFISEGDEVVLFEPACKNYVSAIESNGGRPVFVQLKYPDYSIDWEAVQKLINTRTKLIMINTPHNPTGTLLSENDIAQLQKITNGTKINILSDESFENIIYGQKKHISVLSDANLAEKSIVVFSLGKTFNVPGWKIGYCLGSEKLTSQIRKKQQFQINAVNTPLQYAFAEYLNKGYDKNQLLQEYEENRQLVSQIFKDLPFEFTPPHSTYFQLLSYENISGLKDTEFVQKIMDNYGVALFPVSVFYHDYVDHKMVGLNFALNKEVLIEAANRLKNLK